jgi:hypothetical protein
MKQTTQTNSHPYWPEYRKQDWVLIHQDLVSLEGAAAEAALIIQSGLQGMNEKDDDDYLEFPVSAAQFDEIDKSAERLGITK